MTGCKHMNSEPGVISSNEATIPEALTWRRKCGCIRTSEKLKKILHSFPSPPPPTPMSTCFANTCISSYCGHADHMTTGRTSSEVAEEKKLQQLRSTSWHVVAELVQLVQLSVTATALALYYLIYCYMQLVYYTLRSALYFHHADLPMKITIGVVTMTSVIVGFNLILRMEKVIAIIV
ncbi:uncharacterized protein LOC142977183 [Anticarsia gemmatalis]|uniref:uncharacterized protein LOC142977183 n=1 Tax=Anticarsia gemmatalis TaxID=129554 RepID=UPI003F769E85